VIGPRFDPTKIGHEDDPLRLELLEAMVQNIAIVPVLVDDAQMPTAEQWPSGLKSICFLHAARLRSDPDFLSDSDLLIRHLTERLESSAPGAAQGSQAWSAELYARDQSNKPNFTVILRSGDLTHSLEFLGSPMRFRVTLDGQEIWRGGHLLTWRSIRFELKDGIDQCAGMLRVRAGLASYAAAVNVGGVELLAFER
jgi:hypothetical protein